MRSKKLISIDEARPSSVQHKTPCSDCPFRRDSLNGWLGGHTSEFFMQLAFSDELYDCHAKIGPQCAGLATFRGNICKSPRDPRVLRLPANRDLVFSRPLEFTAHHGEGEKNETD